MTRHWYFITIHYCPQCGSSDESRERRHTPRPEKWEDRHATFDTWDYCGVL